MNGGGGAPSLLGLLGRDDCDGFTEVPHPVDREHRLVRELEAEELLSRDALMRENRMNARHPRCLRGVDRDDACVRVRAPHGLAPEHARSLEVARVRELPCHLRYRVATANARLRVTATKRFWLRRRAHRRTANCTASRIFW
jgi:hypothetical protein